MMAYPSSESFRRQAPSLGYRPPFADLGAAGWQGPRRILSADECQAVVDELRALTPERRAAIARAVTDDAIAGRITRTIRP